MKRSINEMKDLINFLIMNTLHFQHSIYLLEYKVRKGESARDNFDSLYFLYPHLMLVSRNIIIITVLQKNTLLWNLAKLGGT